MMDKTSPKRDVQNHILFECAWEVANKVGGIHTVVSTKVPITVAEYGHRYTLIGPLTHKAALEVEPSEPADPFLVATLEAMREHGVKSLYGRWLIQGAPQVLLFDTTCSSHHLDKWTRDLWTFAGIPVPPHDAETNDAILFGYLIAWFLGEVSNRPWIIPSLWLTCQYVSRQLTTAVVAHFHEWQAGVAIPICRCRRIDVTTVFTTHATLLGRYLSAGGVDFYNNIQYFDADHEARKRGIYHRYCIERASAHCTDVFTTVSHITAFEAKHLLKRTPDGVVPNGLNVDKFQGMWEPSQLCASRAKIHEFIRGHFYGHCDFNPEDALYVGRTPVSRPCMLIGDTGVYCWSLWIPQQRRRYVHWFVSKWVPCLTHCFVLTFLQDLIIASRNQTQRRRWLRSSSCLPPQLRIRLKHSRDKP